MYYLELHQGYSAQMLQSDTLAAPYRGAVIAGETAKDGRVVTVIQVALDGSIGEIESAITSLAQWLDQVRQVVDIPGAGQVYLQVQLYSGAPVWRSRVLSGRLELLGQGAGQRVTGSQGVRLTLEREPFWEDAAEAELPLASLASTRRTGGVSVHNCWDTSYGNYVTLAGSDAGGELPAPVRLVYTVNSFNANGSLYAGQNVNSNPAGLICRVEGEAGAAVSPAALAAETLAEAGGGSFGRLSWSGSGPAVYQITLSSITLRNMAGRSFLPVMRLANAISAGEAFWAFWRAAYNVGANKDVLAETRPGYLVNADRLQPGSPIWLPPWTVESGESPSALQLELVLQADDSGSHALDIDFVYLLPLEYWRFYRMSASYLAGLVVHDNPYTGTLKSYSAMQGHQAEGPGLWAVPGITQRFYFLAEAGGLGAFSNSATVQMYYRPRKAQL